MQMQLEDAKLEYTRGGEGSENRLARCQKELADVMSLGSDADVGLTDFADLRYVYYVYVHIRTYTYMC